MRPEKRFATACHERVYWQVDEFLDELVDEHFDDAEHCDFYLKFGSTVIEISTSNWHEDQARIEIFAFCVHGVEPTLALTSELLVANSRMPLGAFSMVGEDVFFSHSFITEDLRPDELMASLTYVAATADDYDDRITNVFGGKTALERLRSIPANGEPHGA